MVDEIATRRENVWFLVVNYVILVAAAVVGLRFAQPLSPVLRGVVFAVLVAIAVMLARTPRLNVPRWRAHVYLGLYAALVAVLLFLQPGWTMYPVLFGSPAMWATLALPVRQSVAWIAVFTAITATSFAVGTTLSDGAIALFVYGTLYAFMSVFARLLARADAARRQSQALLAELQEAHHGLQEAHSQLQEYAARAEELAVVEERNRLAREMHDTLGHHLTVASVQLEGARRICATDTDQAAAMIDTVREEVREALTELRSTVRTLRAPIEADLHLLSALPRLADRFAQATGLTVCRDLPAALPPLRDAARLALLRAAQEALTNIEKHAGAGQVWLALEVEDGAVTLRVSDDGRGIAAAGGQPGFGLQGLRERARQLGGELRLGPRAGGGTELSFRLPLGVAPADVAATPGTGEEKHG